MAKFNFMEFLQRPGKDVQVNGLVMSVGETRPNDEDKRKAKDKGWAEPKDSLYLLVNANDLGEIKVKADVDQWKRRELEEFVGGFCEIPIELTSGTFNGKPWESFKLSGLPVVVGWADGREVGAPNPMEPPVRKAA